MCMPGTDQGKYQKWSGPEVIIIIIIIISYYAGLCTEYKVHKQLFIYLFDFTA